MLDLNQDNFIDYAVNTYSDMLIRISYQHTRSKADSEDIVQDVFFALIKQANFNEEAHLKAWLIRVTINKCKNYLKSSWRKKTVPLESAEYKLTKFQNNILEELQELPDEDRNILYLFYYEGYSAKEIAKIFDKTESAVFTQLNRARAKLKKSLLKNETVCRTIELQEMNLRSENYGN